MRLKILLTAVSISTLSGACAYQQYRYVPTEHAATLSTDHTEAVYQEPAEKPSGSMRVQYAGIEDLVSGTDQSKVPALHLRLVASNSAESGNWNLSSRDTFVSFPDGVRAEAVISKPASLSVGPGELRGMDLYFTLPEKLNSSGKLPEFDFHWQVQAINQNIAETTGFDRVKDPDVYAYREGYEIKPGDGW